MIVLGIDISSVTTGWAVIKNGGLTSYGFINVKQYKHPTVNDRTLYMFGEEIWKLLQQTMPDIVAVENVYFGANTKTAILLAQMSGIARYLTQEYNATNTLTIMPSQVNKLVGIPSRGIKRSERKKAIINGINKQFNLTLNASDDDIADACGIAYCAYRLLANQKPRIVT